MHILSYRVSCKYTNFIRALEKLLHDAKIYARVTGQEEIVDTTNKSSGSIKTTPTNSPKSFESRYSSTNSKICNTKSDIVLIDEDGFRYIPNDENSNQISEDFF